MRDMMWLMRKTFAVVFRNKRGWIVYFGLPIIGALLAMLFYGSVDGSQLRVGVVNEDGGSIAEDAIAFVGQLEQVEVTMTDRAAMDEAIAAGRLDSGMVIAPGFSDGVRAGLPDGIDIVSVKGAQVTGYLKAMLNEYLGNAAAIGRETAGDPAAFDRVYDGYRAQSFKLTGETVKDKSGAKDVTYQTIGYLVLFMMFSAANLSEFILKEKENRTFLRLLSSPVSARTYVLANVAVNLIVMMLQIAATLFFMKFVYRIDSDVPYGLLAPILMLFALSAIGISLAIVAFAKSRKASGALQNLIITPTCLLAGCFFPMNIMPEPVQKISTFLPQHWLLDTVGRLQQGATLGSLRLHLLILLAFAAAFALIAIYRFGRNNDTRMFV